MTRKVIVSATLATAALMTMAGTALADNGRGMGFGRDRGDGRHFLGGILVLAVVAALAVLATWFAIRRRPAVAAAGPVQQVVAAAPTASAESILADRLARSEITPDDYRATLAALREVPPSQG
jgi:uncharacterized membrane protein